MRRNRAFIAVGFVFSLALGLSGAGVVAADSTALHQQMQNSLESLQQVGVLGSVLSMSVTGRKPVIVANGFANIERTVAVDANRLFQIGSQTKMFTAAAVLLLQRQHKLDIDDLVSAYVAGVPRPESLTVRHLLQHTGGIGDSITFFDPPLGNRPDFDVSFENHLFLGRVAGEQFHPGEDWHYNNLGFVILGKVIAAASEQPLDQYIRANILEPLQMDDTYIGHLENYPEDRMARAYFNDSRTGDIIDTTMPDLSWASSAGDMVSSIADMHRWARTLLDEDNAIGISLHDFTEQSVAVPGGGNMLRYGYGMMQRNLDGQQLWGHGGFIHGYVTLTLVDAESGTVVQIMTNLFDESEEIIAALEGSVSAAMRLTEFASAEGLR